MVMTSGMVSAGAGGATSLGGTASACPVDVSFARVNLLGRSTGMTITRLNNQNRFSC